MLSFAITADLSNLDTERVSDEGSRNGLRIRAPRNEKHDLTHQLVKRLIHVNAALGRRLKERHPKALGKGLPLLERHLALTSRPAGIALKEKRQKEQASRAIPALSVAQKAAPLHSAGITKNTSARDAHPGAYNHDGHVVYILRTQNLVSKS